MLILGFLFFPGTLFAQNRGISPEFPPSNTNIIFIEGEDAVTTNFAVEPTLNYAASGSRTLQLNRAVGLQGSSPFFAEYLFYVEEGGTYQLWYGGTPPGPREDLYPSYSSPFSYSLDGGEERPVFREDVAVRGQYLPTFYWVEMQTLELEQGTHSIRFYVREKRRYDGRFVLYLDNLFFVKENAVEKPGEPKPDRFPPDLTAGTDIQFNTISTYEQAIEAEPENPEHYLRLAYIYSLIGDYINALKTIQRIQLQRPKDPRFVILAAKNRLWRGDVIEGLNQYRRALSLAPENGELWEEAGKIAAWTGNYQMSIAFYADGLTHHPDHLGMTVNLGITHLWKSEEQKAEIYFEQAEKIAGKDPEKMIELASAYRINGYLERAGRTYERAIGSFPQVLELYLRLITVYTELGDQQKAEEVLGKINRTFTPSDRLSRYLDAFTVKQKLQETALNEYRQKVAQNPDNLQLRELLIQTYFWNGRKKEAFREFLHMLGAYTYKQFISLDKESADLLALADSVHIYLTHFHNFSSSIKERESRLSALVKEFDTAVKQMEDGKTEEAPDPEVNEAFKEARNNLALFLERQKALADTLEASAYAYEDTAAAVEKILAEEETDEENFQTAVSDIDWSWDRSFHIAELETIRKTEASLTAHVLGRIYQIESRLDTAALLLKRGTEGEHPQNPTLSALFETYLWQGKWEEASELLNAHQQAILEYAPYLDETVNLFKDLNAEKSEFSGMPRGVQQIRDETEEVKRLFPDMKRKADEKAKTMQQDLDQLHKVLYNRMVRSFFLLESDTYLLRYELGKYYLEEEMYPEATAQFKKVLEIDPWNIDAKFRLGVVRQQYGDWAGAMKRYKAIYVQDPFYPNAAAYYNQLARQHPDSFTFASSLLADTSRIWFEGELSLTTPVTTLLSWTGIYSFDAYRLYKTFSTEDPSAHQLHGLSLELPIDLYFIDLTLTPGAGIILSSELFQDGILSTSSDPLTMGYFLSLWNIAPVVTGSLRFTPDYAGVTLNYRWQPMEETFVPGRSLLQEHFFELSGFYSLQGLEPPFLRFSSARVYGSLEIINDGNVIAAGLEEINFGIHLFDRPWTTLSIIQNVNFEHSSHSSWQNDNGYYAPDSVLSVKGGLVFSSWLNLLRGNSLGISLSAYIGSYWERLATTKPPAGLQAEFSGRFDLVKGGTSYYIRLYGGSTRRPATDELMYWSMTLDFGVNAKTPRLLAP